MEGTVENAENASSTTLKNNWFYTFIQSCISAVIGLTLLLVPKIGVVFISLVFSVYLIWVGVTQVVLAFKLSSIQKKWWLILLRGAFYAYLRSGGNIFSRQLRKYICRNTPNHSRVVPYLLWCPLILYHRGFPAVASAMAFQALL